MHMNDIDIEAKECGRDDDNGLSGYFEISDADFHPPQDDRFYASGVDDIDGGDNFVDFAESFWEIYEDEIYD